MAISSQLQDRLRLPHYGVGEAARYASISAQTVRAWHAPAGNVLTLSPRTPHDSLSYLQLIEVAVVAAFRKAGVSLSNIREARAFAAEALKSDYPFAQLSFKTDGKKLFVDHDAEALLGLNDKGQLAWDAIIGQTLRSFEYESDLALRWRVMGPGSLVIIDPRISFGAPAVAGVPTWLLSQRASSGELIEDISEDLSLDVEAVREGLRFEGLDASSPALATSH